MTQHIQTLSRGEISILTALVGKGIACTLSGLSKMTGRKITVLSLELKQFPVKDTSAALVENTYPTIRIAQQICSETGSYILCIYEPYMVSQDIELYETEKPTLETISNITGFSFLNALTEDTELNLLPSPPEFVTNTLQEIIINTLPEFARKQDDILCIKILIGTENEQIWGTLYIIPTSDLLRILITNFS